MSFEDRYGLPLTTGSVHAVEAYVDGVDRLLSAQPGADERLERAIEADPGFALAHVALARVRQLRMQGAEARELAGHARELLGGVTARERSHVETIARAVDGDAAGALGAVVDHCAAHPRDALVLQLNFGAFGLISFAGRREHDAEMLEFFEPFARARAAFEEGIRARVAPLAPPTNVLTDGTSLLWRLYLDGEPVAPGEWREVAEFARQRFASVAPYFHELHCAMAWAAAGEWDLYERRLAELRDRLAKGLLPPGVAVPALAEGFGAFVRGDYADAARVLAPIAEDIARVGGSHAQQDVFEETLVAAWIRAGEPERAARALERRLARRPSPRAARWLERARAAAA